MMKTPSMRRQMAYIRRFSDIKSEVPGVSKGDLDKALDDGYYTTMWTIQGLEMVAKRCQAIDARMGSVSAIWWWILFSGQRGISEMDQDYVDEMVDAWVDSHPCLVYEWCCLPHLHFGPHVEINDYFAQEEALVPDNIILGEQ